MKRAYRCPSCLTGEALISVVTPLSVNVDEYGNVDHQSKPYPEEVDPAHCVDCDFAGTLADFKIEEEVPA